MHIHGRVGARQLTSGIGEKFQPSWSPDGRWVAYTVSYDGRDADDIFAASPSSPIDSPARQLTSGPAFDSEPSWSPDGRTLLFTRRMPGQPAHIHSLTLSSGELRQLTEDSRADGAAAWSPDGRTIAFSRYVDDQTRLWLMSADGSDQRPVANSVDGDYLADWQRTIDLGVRQRVRKRGQRVGVTIALANRSPAPASAVTIVDRLPRGARLLAKPSNCFGGARVVCRYRNLAANSSRTLTLVVRPPRRPSSNRVSVVSAVVDLNTADNSTVASLPRRR